MDIINEKIKERNKNLKKEIDSLKNQVGYLSGKIEQLEKNKEEKSENFKKMEDELKKKLIDLVEVKTFLESERRKIEDKLAITDDDEPLGEEIRKEVQGKIDEYKEKEGKIEKVIELAVNSSGEIKLNEERKEDKADSSKLTEEVNKSDQNQENEVAQNILHDVNNT